MVKIVFWLVVIVLAGLLLQGAIAGSFSGFLPTLILLGFCVLVFALFPQLFGPRNEPSQSPVQKYFESPRVRRLVDAGEFDRLGLDREFYESETLSLKRLGFREVGDYVEESAAAKEAKTRSIYRTLLSHDGDTMAAILHLHFIETPGSLDRGVPIPRDFYIVEFETELNDGSFVSTSNAEHLAIIDMPNISRRYFEPGMSSESLLAEHERHLAEVRATRPDASIVVHRDFADLCAAQDRLLELQRRFFASRPA